MNTRHLFFSLFLIVALGHSACADSPPKFDEIYQLLRTNLAGVDSTELNQAAVKGLLEQLRDGVMLVGNDSNSVAASATNNAVVKTAIFDGAYAYVRLGKIEDNAAENFRSAYQHLVDTNKGKIKGLVLDLRFAGGDDYAAAGAVADCFLNSDQPLLQWGGHTARASTKTNAIMVPVAILVNGETKGAAEAVAASLRESSIGLSLGRPTAGQANVFKEFPLSNGEKLRVATAQIKVGDGTVLAHGLKPDIEIDSTLAEDKAALEDPYQALRPMAGASTNAAAKMQPPHRIINEAELVRERKAGESLDEESDSTDDMADAAIVPVRPVITDAPLARAIDLLKGLSVLQQSHPG